MKTKLKTQTEPVARRPTMLRFSPTAWAKLLFLRDLGDTEIGGFGISAKDDLLFVEDVQLVAQTCTWVNVEFDDQSVANFFDDQVDAGRRRETFGRLWLHTHPGNSPEPSGTDEATFSRVFSRSDWAVMFILARGGQTFARLRYNVGPGAELESPVEVDFSRPFAGSDCDGWEAEYLCNVRMPPEDPPKKFFAKQTASRAINADPFLEGWKREAWEDYLDFEHSQREEEYGYVPESSDRFARQQDLVPAERLIELVATVIGVRAVGRQVALQLAAIGVRRMQLVDFDRVDFTNVTTQGYLLEDVGQPKVLALAKSIARLDPTIETELIEDRYRPKVNISYGAVFCCVDSIEARGAIWRSAGHRAEFWADGRMLGEAIRILVAADEQSRRHYPLTLFAASEAQPKRCTARSTIYSANIAAGLVVHQFVRYLRRQPVDAEVSLNLLASELVLGGGAG
jgi:hypothetical protein